ncbi:MAG TPA: hypothetical protein VJ842_05150 [Pyrinomonadaceae bacterium]|nr:hypothetical protein [Pyrinomonadaceae bacterium]
MEVRFIEGDKIKPLDGKFKEQEGIVVDVYENNPQRVRVCFPDFSLEIYECSQIELTDKKFDFMRWMEKS